MSTLIEAFSCGVDRMDFSEKENLDFLNRYCAFWDIPEFHINDCYEVPFNFYRISEGFVEFSDSPLKILGREAADMIAAFAISEFWEEGHEIPKTLKRVWELF